MHIKAILAFAAGIAGIAGAAGHHNHVAQSHHRRATSVSAFTSPHGPTMTGTVNTCNKWYKVVSGDTCYSVTQKFGISLEDFLRWNPAVSDDCLTNFHAEVFYCVGVGSISSSGVGGSSTGTPPVTTASTAKNTSTIAATSSNTTTTTPYSTLTYNTTTNPVTITNSAWPPTLTQPGQPDYCNKWHQALQGEGCSSIVAKYSTWMDRDDFIGWNPSVGENCSSIYYGYWYCVGVQPRTSMSETGTATSQWFPPWTYTPPPAMNTTFVPSPVQTGIASACEGYYIAQTGDTCADITSSVAYVTEEELVQWNPALGPECSGVKPGYYYCVWNGTSRPPLPTADNPPSPVPTGTISTCTSWFQVIEGDDCESIVNQFGTFSMSDFLRWNPSVKEDCSGLVAGEYYCVAVPETPSTRTVSATPKPTPTIPPDTISSCSSYWLVGVDENCTTIIEMNDITLDQFVTWNPSVGSDCSGLSKNTYVCVGVSSNGSNSSTSSTTSPPITSTTATSHTTAINGATPTPTQSGMVDGCIRFYDVEMGNTCYGIALHAGISLSDFYAWNPAVGTDCSNLQAGTFVCIGKSGYATTITSGTPEPVTPTPTQTGMVTSCARFYDVHSGDGCWEIASEAGIPLSKFYSWNPAVSTDCSGLQASVFVCIGTNGPITTITSGTPVPVTITSA